MVASANHLAGVQVGSVHKLHFVDGAEWTIQIQEVSGQSVDLTSGCSGCACSVVAAAADFAHRLVFDLLERNDGVEVASCMHEISLTNITQATISVEIVQHMTCLLSQDNSTLVEYTVDYSNDVDAQVRVSRDSACLELWLLHWQLSR